MGRASLLLLVAMSVFTGCADNTPPGARFTCRAIDSAECVDYVAGFTEDTARGLCDPATSTFSTTGECPTGHTARCTVTIDGVAIVYWYTLFADDLAARCAALGGDFVES